jgi:hypothetical protein
MTDTETFASAYFENDIATHEMQVIREDGVNRHIRFKRPGTMCMHFDLITWPGYLCYTGDMGTYVFRRLHDMFEFFRRGENRDPYQISLGYWAEKLEASDRNGAKEWDADQFVVDVHEHFNDATIDDDEWPKKRRIALWDEIDERVLRAAEDGEHFASAALHDFEYDGFRFQDWERDSRVWTHRFLWCCHALEWAIGTYDAARAEATEISSTP